MLSTLDSYPLLSKVFRYTSEGIILVDERGKVLACNHAAGVLFGYSEKQLTDLSVLFVESVSELLAKAHKNKKFLASGRTASGSIKPITLKPYQEHNGPDTMFLLLMEDHSVLQELQKSHELLEYSEELAKTGTFEFNLVNQQSTRSRGLMNLLGLSKSAKISGIQDFMDLVHPDDRQLLTEILEKFKAGVAKQNWELRIITPKHGARNFRAFGKLFKDSQGNPERVLGVVNDITKMRNWEIKSLQAVMKAQEMERTQFAQEIHDGLGPSITGVKLYLEQSKPFLTSNKNAEKSYEENIKSLDDLHKSIRDFSHKLFPKVLLDFGLGVALENLCDRLESNTNLEVVCLQEGDVKRFNKDSELNCYRIIQELANNTITHACASKFKIAIICRNNILHIAVEDDGVGYNTKDKQVGEGIGLADIRSRIKALRGTINISSTVNKGTWVSIQIPIKP